MKNMFGKKIVAAFGFSLVAAASQAATTVNIAADGGFESGNFDGWTVFEINGGVAGVSTDNPSSGTYSGVATCDTGGVPCDVLLKNANRGIGVVQAGSEIVIKFDYRGTQADGGVIFAELFSELDGGGVSKAEILSGGPLFGTSQWQTAMFTTTLGTDVAGGVTLQLKSGCGGAATCLSVAYFDNVEMLVPAPVPLPAAAWLFGSALMGLVGLSRRRNS
ncbi:hypothetical protein [Candidatus Litorirhabdus singularis]|uniref:hypothetical protein n=1 Tax=Candidatus Litorirhabdus singularis TaxID=2518993 RepID=UPI0024328743|nr:hypothetical protein [Candidatus Litorirhabdus singularis]